MTLAIRAAAGQPNFRPRPSPKADRRPRAASSAAGPISTGQTPTPAPAPTGGFPLWCIPLMVVSAAMPIYGFKKQVKEIEAARARQRAGIAAAEKTGK